MLYILRWYEISNRAYDPRCSWIRSLSFHRFRPVRVFCRECVYAVFHVACYIIAFVGAVAWPNRREYDPARLKRDAPVVVLIHGLLGKKIHFCLMKLRFRLKGTANVVIFGYRASGNDTVADYSAQLRDFILRIKGETGISRVVLVGHSLGGLIAHDYACKHGKDGDVKALVTLGAPFRGSRITALAITGSARRLHPSNPMFGDIISSSVNAPFLSVYSVYDQLVLPYTNSEHPLADRNREIALCGHTGLLYHGKVFRIVHEWISGALAN